MTVSAKRWRVNQDASIVTGNLPQHSEEDKENSYLVTPAKSPRVSDEMVDPKLVLLHREQDRRTCDQEMLQTAMNHIIEMSRKFT